MRCRRGIVLTLVFILAAMHFSIISFGETYGYAGEQAPAPAAAVRPAVSAALETGSSGAFSASWQDRWSKELNDLIYRDGLKLDAGTSVSFLIPEELAEGAESIAVSVYDLDGSREVYREEDCAAGESFFWKAEADGRYYVAALIKNGEETQSVGLNDYVLTEVSEPGGRSGGVIPLAAGAGK